MVGFPDSIHERFPYCATAFHIGDSALLEIRRLGVLTAPNRFFAQNSFSLQGYRNIIREMILLDKFRQRPHTPLVTGHRQKIRECRFVISEQPNCPSMSRARQTVPVSARRNDPEIPNGVSVENPDGAHGRNQPVLLGGELWPSDAPCFRRIPPCRNFKAARKTHRI